MINYTKYLEHLKQNFSTHHSLTQRNLLLISEQKAASSCNQSRLCFSKEITLARMPQLIINAFSAILKLNGDSAVNLSDQWGS